MKKTPSSLRFLFMICISIVSCGQQPAKQSASVLSVIPNVEPQPLLAQAIRLHDALSFLGSALSKEDANRLKELQDKPLTKETSALIQAILDPYCLAMVDINPETRVKVLRGPANARLVQGGWTSFLIKVHNDARVTAALEVESANAQPVLHISSFEARALEKNKITKGHTYFIFTAPLELMLSRNLSRLMRETKHNIL